MHAYDLRKTNKSAFQRGTQNEGRDAGGSELILLLGIQEPGAAGWRQNLPGPPHCGRQCFIWFLTNPVLLSAASKSQTQHLAALNSHLLCVNYLHRRDHCVRRIKRRFPCLTHSSERTFSCTDTVLSLVI